MNIKPIEMQIAIPRTGDAGITQNQLTHKPIFDQSVLAEGMVKLTEELRHKSGKVDLAAELHIHDENKEQQEKRDLPNKNKKQVKKAVEKVEHPFKGHHIDFTL
jgi:hypothetical protein